MRRPRPPRGSPWRQLPGQSRHLVQAQVSIPHRRHGRLIGPCMPSTTSSVRAGGWQRALKSRHQRLRGVQSAHRVRHLRPRHRGPSLPAPLPKLPPSLTLARPSRRRSTSRRISRPSRAASKRRPVQPEPPSVCRRLAPLPCPNIRRPQRPCSNDLFAQCDEQSERASSLPTTRTRLTTSLLQGLRLRAVNPRTSQQLSLPECSQPAVLPLPHLHEPGLRARCLLI